MLPLSARRNSQGFTLIEILVIVAIIGILTAIATPSFFSLLSRKRVDDALTKVQGSLQEAQTEAIRKSRTCTVSVPEGNNVTLTSSPEDVDGDGVLDAGEDTNNNAVLDKNTCLITGNRTLDEVAIASNLPLASKQITFSFRGNTVNSGTVVLSKSDGSGQRRCLVISNGIGLMRTGTYTGSTASIADITAGTCTTSQ